MNNPGKHNNSVHKDVTVGLCGVNGMGVEENKKGKDGIFCLRNKEKEERSETGQKETCSEGCKEVKGCVDDQVQSFEEDILHRTIRQSD